jgi:hypothetical protein
MLREPYADQLNQTFTLLSGQEDLKVYADPATQSTQPLDRHFCSNCGSNIMATTPVVPAIVSIFAGGWAKEVDDWVPQREQFCLQRLTGEWLVMPKGVARTTTNPMSEVMKD